jgi:hypothetical protein
LGAVDIGPWSYKVSELPRISHEKFILVMKRLEKTLKSVSCNKIACLLSKTLCFDESMITRETGGLSFRP